MILRALLRACTYTLNMHGGFMLKSLRERGLTLSPVETCFHNAHMNLYGVFILGVNIKYGLCFSFFGQ